VNITGAPIIVCEGDEYPASTLEKRPNSIFFSRISPSLPGSPGTISNVFPTWESTGAIPDIHVQDRAGGILIYNGTRPGAEKTREDQTSSLRKSGYWNTPLHHIQDGTTIVEAGRSVSRPGYFGDHNCESELRPGWCAGSWGIDAATFMKGIVSFSGCAKRLELLRRNGKTKRVPGFAHAPPRSGRRSEAVKKPVSRQRL